MTYQEQLQTNKWKRFRHEILERDEFQCKKCKRERPKFLRLSKHYGIKGYKDLLELDSGIKFYLFMDDNKILCWLNLDTGFVQEAKIIPYNNFEIEESYFALQYDEYTDGRQLICFSIEDFNKSEKTDLHVHHTYYVSGKKAWEYPKDDLETLCPDCHQKEHEEKDIPVYESLTKNRIISYAKTCTKCNGSGYLEEFHYYENGVCFKCWGEGVLGFC